MLKGWKWRTFVAALAFVGIATVTSYAVILGIAGIGAVIPVLPPPAGNFATAVVINTNPVAAGGYGDQIVTVEVGRDSYSPFCQIGVNMGAANPSYLAAAAWAGVPAPAGIYGMGFPGWFYPVPQVAQFPVAPTPAFVVFTYRPTHDPVNPGWPAAPAAVNQIEAGLSLCHGIAEEFARLRAATPSAAAPAGTWAEFYTDMNPANATFLEFWQFRIVR